MDFDKGKYQKDVQGFQQEIHTLNKIVSKKDNVIKQLSKDKDELHQELDDKAERIEVLKSKLLEAENKKVSIEVNWLSNFLSN